MLAPVLSTLPAMKNSLLFSLALATSSLAGPLEDKDRPVANTAALSAAETAGKMKLPPGFSVQVVAAEPDVDIRQGPFGTRASNFRMAFACRPRSFYAPVSSSLRHEAPPLHFARFQNEQREATSECPACSGIS